MGAIIAGSGNVCIGGTLDLDDTSDGSHLWTSSNPSVATINPGNGTVSGLTAGTTVISYRYTMGCTNYAQTVITVDATPSVDITGSAVLCSTGTVTLTGTPGGGTWSSSSVTRAAVDGSGIVTGGASGTATITYYYENMYGCGNTATTP